MLGIATACVGAPIDWPHLKLTRVAQFLNQPTCITSARDGTDRIFVAERFGKIKVFVNGELQPEPFLDISNKLQRLDYAYGIPGLAFPPNFSEKRYFYVHYTRHNEALVLSRFHVPPGSAVADINSEEVIMTVNLPFDWYRHCGYMDFGPDGYLYIAIGEPERYSAQALDNLAGKILRIDTESTNSGYTIPSDNPFAEHAVYRNEIWSWGLFTPWSFSFDRLTGDFYMIDKRGADHSEINYAAGGTGGGVNYGWPNPEGNWSNPDDYQSYNATPPVLLTSRSYERSVGGVVHRGPQPSRMDGIYVFGGHGFRSLAGLARDGTNWVRHDFPEAPITAEKFGQDDAGRLYVLSYEGSSYYGTALYRIEDSGKALAPNLLPSGVIYTDTPVLASVTPGARIRYTTDGHDPVPGDPEIVSGQTITISTGMTVKAQALRDDLLPSDISVATYTSFKVAYPVFVPGPGAVQNPSSITITSATPGAVIRYTTNGTHPTLSSPIYAGPLVVPGDAVVYARGYRDGFQDSDLNGATYTWAIAEAPIFSPASGPITNGTWIAMSSPTPGAKIRYTLNGTEPTGTSPKYTNSIRINGNTTVKAITFAKGYKPSAVTTMRFDLVKPERPVFSPAPGTIAYGTLIQISCATTGVTIRYSTNGLAPTTSSPTYAGPIPIFRNTILKARAFKAQMDPSLVALGDFQLPVTAAPTFTPGEGILTGNTLIAISCATSNAQIRYTLDGTTPGATSTLYGAAFTLVPPATLSARAFAFGMNSSEVSTAYYPALFQEPVMVQTVAGNGGLGYRDGHAANAMFHQPLGLCVDEDGTIFVADTDNHVIRKISTNNVVSTLPIESLEFIQPLGILIDPQGRLYVAETPMRRIRVITREGQFIRLMNVPVSWDDAGLWHIAMSSSGLLHIGSSYEIFTMSANRTFSRLAGDRNTWGWVTSVALNASNKLFAVTGGRLLTFDGVQQRLLAGGPEGFSDGPGLKARFGSPYGVTVGRDKKIFIADGHVVRMFNTGHVSTVAGYAGPGYRNGTGSEAQFILAGGICVDKKGVIYLTDRNRIRKISFDRDHDTIPDPEDAAVGIDDRVVDSDGDGESNAEEFWAATNPNDANSMLKVQARYDGSNGVVLSWPTAPARSYVLASSTNLIDWESSAPVVGDSITNSLTVLRKFYRLRVEP